MVRNRRLHAKLKNLKKIAYIVCVSDDVVGEGASFNFFMDQSGKISELGLYAVELLTIQDLEDALYDIGVKGLVFELHRKWQSQKNRYAAFATVHGNVIRGQSAFVAKPWLEKEWAEILPELIPRAKRARR